MCTLFVLINKIENIPVSFVLNRDEFHHRKSLPIQFLDKDFNVVDPAILSQATNTVTTASGFGGIVAPKDEVKGGTWFGFLKEKDFKYAALTNIRNPIQREENKESRGLIIKDFLNSALKPKDYLLHLKKTASEYNGFNLVFGNDSQCFHFNSASKSSTLLWDKSQTKKEKIYGISNATLDSHWPKVIYGKKKLSEILAKSFAKDPKFLWEIVKPIMQDQTKFSLRDLPMTGISEELEVFLSSRFIVNERYGTRSTLFFLFKKEHSNFFEMTYDKNGNEIEEKNISFL